MTKPVKNKKVQKKQFPLSILFAAVTTALGSSALYANQDSAEQERVDTGMLQVIGQATAGMDGFIGQEALEQAQANDLADIFKHDATISAGGSVQLGQKIYLRNIGENMLNISIDGAEQAGAVFHHSGSISIEPELLKQVEVEAGAGSATAGPGAMGGSVRFVTKDPSDLLKPGETAGALVKAQYFSNGEVVKTSATVFAQDSDEKFGVMLSAVNADQDELEDGDSQKIPGTESERQLGYAKFVANLTDEHRLALSYENLDEEGKAPYRPELATGPKNVAEPTEATRTTSILAYDYTPTVNDLVDLSLTLYNTKQEQMREFRGTAYDGYVESTGLTVQNTSILGDHELVYGLNYRDDKAFQNDVSSDPSQYKETGEVKGAFVQDTFEATAELTISGGVRFDQYTLNEVNGQKFDDSGVSPNLSANYAISPTLSVSAGYGEVMRGVELKDSFKLSSGYNSPDLEAETAKNLELGVDYSHNGLNLSAGVYRSVIEDPIGGAAPWSKEYINMEHDIKTTGFTLSGDYSWDKLSVSASFNHADSEANGQTVTRYVYSSTATSIGDTLVLNVAYDVNPDLKLGWTATHVSDINDINLNVAGYDLNIDKPGYDVHDVYVRWQPLEGDKLTLMLAINNLFDKQYLSHSSVEDFSHNPDWGLIKGTPEPGRDVRLSAAVRF